MCVASSFRVVVYILHANTSFFSLSLATRLLCPMLLYFSIFCLLFTRLQPNVCCNLKMSSGFLGARQPLSCHGRSERVCCWCDRRLFDARVCYCTDGVADS
ncbi:unnamed protein product [Ceratitis capitata]|uniref:(Mediterranean fruit fly) hypothetical protein n=1 Tax=Ceratitis capitata TaxID=7213 RepID=A0A811V348_CERCA|nr:unnamed protein product [Ceratitis capitata]